MLLAAGVQDAIQQKVSNFLTGALCLLGAVRVCQKAEDRWETVILTCLFLVLLLGIYFIVLYIGQHTKKAFGFGGADIKLIAGIMLFLGWQKAFEGMFVGLCTAVGWYFVRKVYMEWKRSSRCLHRELPLVPWLAGGIFAAEFFEKVFDLFFAKAVLY